MGYGITRATVHDGLLDHINAQNTCMNNALDDIAAFILEHPEHEDDPRLVSAQVALL